MLEVIHSPRGPLMSGINCPLIECILVQCSINMLKNRNSRNKTYPQTHSYFHRN